MKILFFTDSRGEHAVKFKEKIFTKKFKKNFMNKHDIDLILCPYKWTTLMDFVYLCKNKIINIDLYDLIILYIGIVDFSPRPISGFNKAYNGHNDTVKNINCLLNPKKKIVNSKKKVFESIVNPAILDNHLNSIDKTIYQNEFTRSLINEEIMKNNIIPFLKEIDNKLIYINCNKIHSTWEGNYIKINPNGRPKNINNIINYNYIMSSALSNIIDLSVWDNNLIIKYTIDNMHLTYEGSEYIYNKLIELIKKCNFKI
mgnify:CR=1 FL=1|tara:strand:+ start:1389 stop:2159 length:771 start_codon:yes stop_codon:yes gene_type:complete